MKLRPFEVCNLYFWSADCAIVTNNKEAIMTNSERLLLLTLGDWVAEQEDEIAKKAGTTSNWAATIRKHLDEVRREAGLRD